MRKKALLGVGLALFGGGTGTAQFPMDRAPVTTPRAPMALPPGLSPVTPQPVYPVTPVTPGSGYVPPTSGLQPAPVALVRPEVVPLPTNLEIKTSLGADHPWLIRPEHGPYFIMVKSYVRPAKGSKGAEDDKGLTARELAEGLATEIRDQYRVQAFLFEYISEERKAEMRQIAVARQKAQTYYAQLDVMRQRSQLQGMEFMQPDNKLHVMTHNHKDQIGVLVGGFQTETDATKALTKLKTWPTPKNEVFLDKGSIVQPGADGKPEVVRAAMNPYATAFVVPNPSIPRTAQAQKGLDPFVVKLNEGQPYNLLKATKGWTLAVKSFTAPVELVNKDSDTSLMRKIGFGQSGGNALAAGAEQAESLAKALRQLKGPVGADGRGGQSLNLEAFVLHTRNASLVTVGQFDGPDDPALVATKKLLTSFKVNASKDQVGAQPITNTPSVFDNMLPIPVPRP